MLCIDLDRSLFHSFILFHSQSPLPHTRNPIYIIHLLERQRFACFTMSELPLTTICFLLVLALSTDLDLFNLSCCCSLMIRSLAMISIRSTIGILKKISLSSALADANYINTKWKVQKKKQKISSISNWQHLLNVNYIK